MLRRFILLVFVAGLSGTVGLWVGLFYAPAPGEDTRQKLSTFFSENEGTFDDLFARSRQALGDAIDAVSGTLKAEGESEPDKQHTGRRPVGLPPRAGHPRSKVWPGSGTVTEAPNRSSSVRAKLSEASSSPWRTGWCSASRRC